MRKFLLHTTPSNKTIAINVAQMISFILKAKKKVTWFLHSIKYELNLKHNTGNTLRRQTKSESIPSRL